MEKSEVNKSRFWNEKYTNKNMPWDIGQVAPAFVRYFTRNKSTNKGRVAVLGCGKGHDAFHFASFPNFEVYGFDFSESAIKFCNKTKLTKNISNINFFNIDFFKLINKEKWKNFFDYVIEHTSFCAIHPERRKEYVELIKYLLKPNGKLVGLFFMKPKELGGPPYGFTREEVKEYFKKNFVEIKKLHLEECLHANLTGEEWFGVFKKKPLPVIWN